MDAAKGQYIRFFEHILRLLPAGGILVSDNVLQDGDIVRSRYAVEQMCIRDSTNDVCHMPVFRPLIGMDKQEIVNIAERIDTFETSIQPFEDCCTIFVAKHPVTKGNLKKIEKSEENLADVIEELMEKAIGTTEAVSYTHLGHCFLMMISMCWHGERFPDCCGEEISRMKNCTRS